MGGRANRPGFFDFRTDVKEGLFVMEIKKPGQGDMFVKNIYRFGSAQKIDNLIVEIFVTTREDLNLKRVRELLERVEKLLLFEVELLVGVIEIVGDVLVEVTKRVDGLFSGSFADETKLF